MTLDAYGKDIIDWPTNFDPMQTDLREVFENPKARALWMAYRIWHIVCSEDLDALKWGALNIAKHVEENPGILDDFLALLHYIGRWLLQNSPASHSFTRPPDPRETGERESEVVRYTRFILPYLKGEKVATIKLDTSRRKW